MPTNSEPSRVSGYIWLLDPSSNQKYVPEDHLGNTAGDPADLIVVFRSATDGTEVPLRIGPSLVGSDAFNPQVDFSDPTNPRGRRVALHYEIRFRHVPGYHSAPTWIHNGGITNVSGREYRYHWWEITYDPYR